MSAAERQVNALAHGSAPLFAALGDETRLGVITRLAREGPLSITHLTVGTEVTRQAISKHLRVLEAAGLVRSARRGREQVFRIEAARLDDAKRYLDAVSAQWDSALGRLRALVEDET